MFTFSDGPELGTSVNQTKKAWLQGLHPKFVLALNTQPRQTTDWMREQYLRQADQLDQMERQGEIPAGSAAQFRANMPLIEFKVDLESSSGIIEWPLLGWANACPTRSMERSLPAREHSPSEPLSSRASSKRAEDYENPKKPDWPAQHRIFYALNPHVREKLPHMKATLEEIERRRVGEKSFEPAGWEEAHRALGRQRERVMHGVKVSGYGAPTQTLAYCRMRLWDGTKEPLVFGVWPLTHSFPHSSSCRS